MINRENSNSSDINELRDRVIEHNSGRNPLLWQYPDLNTFMKLISPSSSPSFDIENDNDIEKTLLMLLFCSKLNQKITPEFLKKYIEQAKSIGFDFTRNVSQDIIKKLSIEAKKSCLADELDQNERFANTISKFIGNSSTDHSILSLASLTYQKQLFEALPEDYKIEPETLEKCFKAMFAGIKHISQSQNFQDITSILIAKNKGDNSFINCTNDSGETALGLAIDHNNPEITKFLLAQQNIDLNAGRSNNSINLLVLAINNIGSRDKTTSSRGLEIFNELVKQPSISKIIEDKMLDLEFAIIQIRDNRLKREVTRTLLENGFKIEGGRFIGDDKICLNEINEFKERQQILVESLRISDTDTTTDRGGISVPAFDTQRITTPGSPPRSTATINASRESISRSLESRKSCCAIS